MRRSALFDHGFEESELFAVGRSDGDARQGRHQTPQHARALTVRCAPEHLGALMTGRRTSAPMPCPWLCLAEVRCETCEVVEIRGDDGVVETNRACEQVSVEDHRRLKKRSLIAATPPGSGGPDSADHSSMEASRARRIGRSGRVAALGWVSPVGHHFGPGSGGTCFARDLCRGPAGTPTRGPIIRLAASVARHSVAGVSGNCATDECDELKRETVAATRQAGATWEAIGKALGITRQSAWALYSADAAAISADLAANAANNPDLSEDEALDIAVEEVRQVRRARRAR